MTVNLSTDRKPMTVSEITRLVKGLLDSTPALRNVWVAGEVSNLQRSPAGHLYFTLKDSEATLTCVMFARAAAHLRFSLEDGLEALVRGSISVFERRGQYQLYAQEIEPSGIGGLHLAFEQLKTKLAAEGLFDQAAKRPLPVLPRRVALVTSPNGAAVQDMIRVAQRRFPNIHLVVVPVLVQGTEAPADIVRGLRLVPETGADVAIVGRGGGSLEELWAFNDEAVARAIRGCRIPVVSAIGHETDVTIADFAADLRAPTPSAAAELVVPERAALERRIATGAQRIVTALQTYLRRARQYLDVLRDRRVLRDPAAALAAPRQHLDGLTVRVMVALRARLRHERHRLGALSDRPVLRDPTGPLAIRRRHLGTLTLCLASASRTVIMKRRAAYMVTADRLAALGKHFTVVRRAAWRTTAGRLNALSPLGVLARGYSVCRTGDGVIVRRPPDAPVGSDVEVLLAKGRLGCRVLHHGRGIEEEVQP